MKIKILLALINVLLLSACCYAQTNCGTDEQHDWLLKNNQEYTRLMKNRKPVMHKSFRPVASPDTIPVVVHIVYATSIFGTIGNINDSVVFNMMKLLNQAFNEPLENGVKIGLYFKLAQTDPDCRPTNGIVRVDASSDKEYVSKGVHFGNYAGGIPHESLATKSYWDNTKYLNIWVVTSFSDPSIAAYGFYPTGYKTVLDGIVLNYYSTHVIAHEMGHAFNLAHTFNGANGNACPVNNDCNTDGDMVCDTPPVLQQIGCDPLAINPCTNTAYGINAAYNYMSYNGCWSLFTPMQKERMLDVLYTYRSSLLTSNTELPPPQAPLISIVSNDDDNIIDQNQTIKFTPTITSTTAVQYHWLKNGFEVSTNPIYTTNKLVQGDEIICMIEAPELICHVPVRSYSNKIKVSTNKKQFVNIYPNPLYESITAWTPADNIKIIMVRLFAPDGKLLETKTFVPASSIQYSLGPRPAGLYILEFTTNKGKDVIRAMKGSVKYL